MTPEKVELIKESWGKIHADSDAVAELLYTKLFSLDPPIESLFTADMQEQGKKLMKSMGVMVYGVERLETIAPAVENLAVKHVKYGVTPEHYDTVGEALLWAIGEGLGDDLTDEIHGAWVSTFSLISNTMKAAAYPETTA